MNTPPQHNTPASVTLLPDHFRTIVRFVSPASLRTLLRVSRSWQRIAQKELLQRTEVAFEIADIAERCEDFTELRHRLLEGFTNRSSSILFTVAELKRLEAAFEHALVPLAHNIRQLRLRLRGLTETDQFRARCMRRYLSRLRAEMRSIAEDGLRVLEGRVERLIKPPVPRRAFFERDDYNYPLWIVFHTLKASWNARLLEGFDGEDGRERNDMKSKCIELWTRCQAAALSYDRYSVHGIRARIEHGLFHGRVLDDSLKALSIIKETMDDTNSSSVWYQMSPEEQVEVRPEWQRCVVIARNSDVIVSSDEDGTFHHWHYPSPSHKQGGGGGGA